MYVPRTCLLSLIFVLLGPVITWAAPFPGMASSALSEVSDRFFNSDKGFHVSGQEANWRVSIDAEDSFTLARLQPREPKFEDDVPTLTLRLDKLEEVTSIENYARRWMRDFPNYGFEITSSRRFKHSDNDAILIDLRHTRNERHLRQVIFTKDEKAVILTCSGDKRGLSAVLADCNKIIRSFRWL